MSEHQLPEDVRHWPSDPYALFDVSRSASPRDLKRAYTRLIRTYKPEHYPEQFRRLREAYETALRLAEFFADSSASIDGPTDASMVVDVSCVQSNSVQSETSESTPLKPLDRVRSLEDELDDYWQKTCRGEEEAAYAALVDSWQRTPLPVICLRLYWLLALSPQLDPRRTPCDWLVVGLKANGLSGPLRELYRRELSACPAEALSERCRGLLEAPASAGALADLAEWRWQAAARERSVAETIRDDLPRLRRRLLGDEDEVWARLLLSAIDHLTWAFAADAAQLLEDCRQELKSLEHLQFRLSAALDRHDLLFETAKSWRLVQQYSNLQPDLLELIPVSWTCSLELIRPQLTRYLAKVAEQPGHALQFFDLIQRRDAPVLVQFKRLLDALAATIEPAVDVRNADELSDVVMLFVSETPGAKYQEWRHWLLDFCLREAVLPWQVAEVLAERHEVWLSAERDLARTASEDLALVCVCEAHHLFWA